jgi:NAD(P)-dependent dehydrogenase (short-subunit alcohol dehydrogenase family)
MNVVVGAASGMGEAIAHAIAERGPLLVADCKAEGARAVTAAISGDAEAVECDVTDSGRVDALAARVQRLGSLVITAGVSPQSAKTGAEILEVNLKMCRNGAVQVDSARPP